jgi:hypothetical protein
MDNFKQHDFSNYTVLDSSPVRGTGSISRKFMSGVFSWMFAALGISALFAVLFASNASLLGYLYNVTPEGTKLGLLGWIVMLAPLGLMLAISFAWQRMSASLVTLLFVLYSAINGISFSFILLTYTAGSVAGCFATAAIMFGVMAVMGYTTDKDLTTFGSLLTMGLVGLFIAMMVNMLLHSSFMDYIISFAGVAIFTGLTAYDVQKLKRIGAGIEYEGVGAGDSKKLALMGAFTLYLDFINLFIMLLRLFGNKRD